MKTKKKRQNRKPAFRKHFKKDPRENIEVRYQKYWSQSSYVETGPRKPSRLSSRPAITSVREATLETSRHAGSLTQKWLSYFSFEGTVVPRHLSYYEFDVPGNESLSVIRDNEVKESLRTGYMTPRAPTRNRTKEEMRQEEAVLSTPTAPLADYVSPDMMNMIKKSPFINADREVVFRSDYRQTRRQNLLECYRLLSRFLRNVANEIVYREQRTAAVEMIYKGEDAIDDPE